MVWKSLWENGKKNVPEDSGGYTFSEREYLQEFSITSETRIEDFQKTILFLEECCQTDDTVFVHGRGKRKSKKQWYFGLLRGFPERQTVYDWHTAGFQGELS